MTQPDFRALCTELAKLARQDHCRCEDHWYSCPKSPDGCANDSTGDVCNCGADSHNDKIDELLSLIALATPPPKPPTVATKPPTAIEIIDLSIEIDDAGLGIVEFARAVLERWSHG